MNPELKEFVLREFPVAGKALDLGCGLEVDMRGLRELGWMCDGVDLLTGVDLNYLYQSENAPYDLVYSNYVIQKLVRSKVLVFSIAKNLKSGGKFFIHTFEMADEVAKKRFTEESLRSLFVDTALEIESCKQFKICDDEPGHMHYHHILEVTGKRNRGGLRNLKKSEDSSKKCQKNSPKITKK